MPSLEWIFLVAAVLLLISIAASKLSAWAGVPALLLFIGIGMAIGSEGFGGIEFDNPTLTQAVGVVALVFILFSGGLSTQWSRIRPILKEGLLLASIGVALTAVAVAWFAQQFLGFSWLEGFILGATVGSTDAAAVFAVLRGKNIRLKGQVAPILELESGSNDPMAIFLTLGMIALIQQADTSPLLLLGDFVWEMSLGLVLGVALGEGFVWVLNRIRLEYDGLYPVLTITFVLLSFGLTSILGGNGFLACYIVGIVMGRRNFIHKASLLKFNDGLAWLMQILMFLTLGLQVFPSRLLSIAGIGLIVAIFLMFVARPLSVFIALLPTKLSWREKVFLAWLGLRGAAPIVLATFSQLANIAFPVPIFDLVFFVVLASVLLQGTSIGLLARWLGLFSEEVEESSILASIQENPRLNEQLLELKVAQDARVVGQQVLDLGLPKGVLLVLLRRNGQILVPNGSTQIEAGDQVLLLAEKEQSLKLREIFEL